MVGVGVGARRAVLLRGLSTIYEIESNINVGVRH
jgi:hypothetical protein